MSEENKTPEENLPAIVKAAPELLPLYDWWKKEGKSTVIVLALAVVVGIGIVAYRHNSENRLVEANKALVSAFTVEEIESAVENYGSTKLGPQLRLRLAKSYYDAERYQDALNVYDAVADKASGNDPFADIAVIGRGHALEGLAKFKEAHGVFDGYAKAHTNSYLLLDAKLGAARCQALMGDKDGAVKALNALKDAEKDERVKDRIERLTGAVKRYDPNRVAALPLPVPAAPVPAAKPAEAPKPATPAPAAKPAEAPKPAAPAPAAKPAEAPKPATPAPAAKPAEAPKPATPAPADKPAEAKK